MPFQFHARRLRPYCLGPYSFLLADYGYIALALLNFLLADYDYIVYALSVSCSSTMTVLLRPFEFPACRLWLYCLVPFSVLLVDYGYFA
jgi:hypothetical protein